MSNLQRYDEKYDEGGCLGIGRIDNGDFYLASDVDAHLATLELFLEDHLSDEAKLQLAKLEWKS